MKCSIKKTWLKWTISALTLIFVVGCSSLSKPISPTSTSQSKTTTPSQLNNPTSSSSNTTSTISTNQLTDSTKTLLLNMMQVAQQGKIINSEFSVKTNNIADVEKAWGNPDREDYVASSKGTYSTYLSHNVAVGFNKGGQIFEVRSLSGNQIAGITLAKVKEVFGTPTYNTTSNNQEIIGYTAGQEFKIEMVFPQPTTNDANPLMDHYNVLYPQGTVDNMADDPGRQW
ncbi:BlaR1 peptidase M56 family protein (fragment) [Candidatus Desulfosporosinus infrequens]|uniref:BlaR1 peptidase M56 family protein n=1 Tax=Candidatus Desulfosporosinus infrequens TaxID=2043169 RepID=A0A2U3LGU0_9FIRM